MTHLTSKERAFVYSWGFIILMGALTAFDPLTIDMYLPAFDGIQADFKTKYSLVELSLSSFFVGMALGQLIYGPLADRFGRKKPLLIGMSLYGVATLGCAIAPNIETFILLRILQALGGCAGMVITRAIVRDLFDRSRSAQFFSSMALIMGLAPILAPLLGGWIYTSLGWRAIFYILLSANIICLFVMAYLLPETSQTQLPKIAIKKVARTYYGLLRDRNFIGYVIPDAAIRAGMFAYIAGSPFVFIEIFHVDPKNYGWIFGANAIGLMIAAQANRFLLKRFNPDQLLRITLPFSAMASIALFAIPFFSSSFWAVAVPLFFFVASLNFVGPNSLSGALANQGHQAGQASALYGTLQWSLATFSSFGVSHFHNGTSLPMRGAILACGLFSSLAFWILVSPNRGKGSQPLSEANQPAPAVEEVTSKKV